MIQQVWGVDPLKCPLCSCLLRPIAVVETKTEILAVPVPLGRARPHERPFALGPPRPEVAVLIDAADREPVFWSASGGQDFPTADCVQPDAPDGAE